MPEHFAGEWYNWNEKYQVARKFKEDNEEISNYAYDLHDKDDELKYFYNNHKDITNPNISFPEKFKTNTLIDINYFKIHDFSKVQSNEVNILDQNILKNDKLIYNEIKFDISKTIPFFRINLFRISAIL